MDMLTHSEGTRPPTDMIQETIRCSELIDNAMETRRLLQQAGSTPHIEQLPIFGICKDMLLAIRYRLSDGQVLISI